MAAMFFLGMGCGIAICLLVSIFSDNRKVL